MARAIIGSICALALLTVVAVTSEGAQSVLTGTVKQVDPRTGVILFDDGRQVQTTSRTVVIAERPVDDLAAIAPGTQVVVIDPEPSASLRGMPDAPAFSPFGLNTPQAP